MPCLVRTPLHPPLGVGFTHKEEQMPVYDFKCECGNTRTQTISINAPDFKAICICGKEMIRVYGLGGVTFKGSGWGKDKN